MRVTLRRNLGSVCLPTDTPAGFVQVVLRAGDTVNLPTAVALNAIKARQATWVRPPGGGA